MLDGSKGSEGERARERESDESRATKGHQFIVFCSRKSYSIGGSPNGPIKFCMNHLVWLVNESKRSLVFAKLRYSNRAIKIHYGSTDLICDIFKMMLELWKSKTGASR